MNFKQWLNVLGRCVCLSFICSLVYSRSSTFLPRLLSFSLPIPVCHRTPAPSSFPLALFTLSLLPSSSPPPLPLPSLLDTDNTEQRHACTHTHTHTHTHTETCTDTDRHCLFSTPQNGHVSQSRAHTHTLSLSLAHSQSLTLPPPLHPLTTPCVPLTPLAPPPLSHSLSPGSN